MRRLVLLHTNDIHGRIDGLARVATLVERIRAEEDAPVLYLDAGDIEETTVRISNLTKGIAMHRILSAAGCDVATAGNAAWLRYGPQILADHAAAATYPLLLANLRPVDGVVPSVILTAGEWKIGVIGVTDDFADAFGDSDFGVRPVPVVPLVRELARELRKQGAELIVVLSHLGWTALRDAAIVDPDLANALEGEIDLVIGAHSHDLLPEGEWVAGVLVTQAGSYAEQLGRIDIDANGMKATMIPVGEDVPLHGGVLEVAASEERELGTHLREVIGEIDRPLDVPFVAEVYRSRMDADVGLATEFVTLDAPLPLGPIRRGDLWEVCHSGGNPGVVDIVGNQLLTMIERGNDPAFQSETPRTLRGHARGRLYVVGPTTIDPDRTYRVAGSDWELSPYGGLVDAEWRLQPRYDFPTIVREAVEEYLAAR